jgi:hypothetical protein
MKLVTALLIATTAIAFAGELPLVEFIDTTHPSKDEEATIHANGHNGPIHLRTFGSDKIEKAREFGLSLGRRPDKEAMIWAKAAALYPNDKFFQKAFVQFAR